MTASTRVPDTARGACAWYRAQETPALPVLDGRPNEPADDAERSAMNDDTGITPEQGVLRDLMLSGGGTYRGDTLAAFRPTDGYAVGIGGVARRIDGDTPLGADELGLLLRDLAEAYSTTYVGTWLQGNVAYLDAVLIHWDVEQALRTAAYHGQDSIYDFAAGESIKVFAQQWDS